MRVDLRLQGPDLGAGRELRLAVELGYGQLRREQVGEATGDSHLGPVDLASAAVVQLEHAHRVVEHHQRHEDGRRISLHAPALLVVFVNVAHLDPLQLVEARKGLDALALKHLARRGTVEGTGSEERDLLAHVGKRALGVRHGDGRGLRLGQQQLADGAAAHGVKAGTHVHQRYRGKAQHALRLLRAHVVGNQKQAAADDDDHGQAATRHHGRHQVARPDAPGQHGNQRNGHHAKTDVENGAEALFKPAPHRASSTLVRRHASRAVPSLTKRRASRRLSQRLSMMRGQ